MMVERGTTMEEESSIITEQAALGQEKRRQRQMNFWRKLIVSLVLLLIIGSIFAIAVEVILPEEGQWAGLTSHRCEEFCESSHQCDHTMEDRPTVQQPVNAYTNLAYIYYGLVPMVFIRIDLSTFMYFCASTLLAIASFMFHASVSSFWAGMDGAYMFTYGMALIFHGIFVVFCVPYLVLAPILVALFVTIPLKRSQMKIDLQLIMAGMFVVVVILVVILAMARIYMIVACQPKKKVSDTCTKIWRYKAWQISIIIGVACVPAIISGVAFSVWYMDMSKEWCNPASAWQWHGVWHVFTGIASLWTWIFFDKNRLKEILSTSYPPTIDDRVQKGNLSKEGNPLVEASTEIFQSGETGEDNLYDHDPATQPHDAFP